MLEAILVLAAAVADGEHEDASSMGAQR